MSMARHVARRGRRRDPHPFARRFLSERDAYLYAIGIVLGLVFSHYF